MRAGGRCPRPKDLCGRLCRWQNNTEHDSQSVKPKTQGNPSREECCGMGARRVFRFLPAWNADTWRHNVLGAGAQSWAQSSQDRSTPVVQPEYFCSQNDNPAPRHTKDRSESPCVGHALLQAQASEPIAINAPSKSKIKDQTPRSVCKKDPDINVRAC